MSGFGKRGLMGLAALVAVVGAVPAVAQMRSEGSKFLQAVDDKKNNTVIDMLAAPGSTIINSRDLTTNRTALHIVVQRRDEAMLRFLLARGADPNLADNAGVSPLLLACRINFLPGVQALVDKNARVDEANAAGETPLLSAVHSHNGELMRILLKAGADPDRPDNSGRSARDYAKLDHATTLLADMDRDARTKNRQASSNTYGPS